MSAVLETPAGITWRRRGAVLVPAVLCEPDESELAAYRWCAVPVEDRPRPLSCGRPGRGRKVHREHGEPTCPVCAAAEAEYARARREQP